MVCFIQGNLAFICCLIEISVIQGISCYRLFCLQFPFHARSLSPTKAKQFLIGLSAFITLYMVGSLFMGQHYYFDPYLFSCQLSGQTDAKFFLYTLVNLIIITFLGVMLLRKVIITR